MKKTILATAIALASASAFAIGGPPGGTTGSASGSIHGAGVLAGGSSATAVAVGNGESIQVSGSSAVQTITVNADTLCRDNAVGVRLSGAASGATEAFAAGSVTGNASGTSEAFAIQAAGIKGMGVARISDRDMHVDLIRGRGIRGIVTSGAGGTGGGMVMMGGVEASGVYVKNIDSGFAAQVAGAGFDTETAVKITVDARANGTHAPSGVNLEVVTKNSGEGYSYAGGEVEDAFGISGAGYIQGSKAVGGAVGGANEYAATGGRRGYTNDYASADGGVFAKSKQGSAGGAINIGDGMASNATATQADQTTGLKLRVNAAPDGASASAMGTSETVAVAASVNIVDDALGGSIAGAKAYGDYWSNEYTSSQSDCYVGRGGCGDRPRPPGPANNGYGNGGDSDPYGFLFSKNWNKGQDDVD